jgi:hypothetical protein
VLVKGKQLPNNAGENLLHCFISNSRYNLRPYLKKGYQTIRLGKPAHGLAKSRVDEDEGSPFQSGVNREKGNSPGKIERSADALRTSHGSISFPPDTNAATNLPGDRRTNMQPVALDYMPEW